MNAMGILRKISIVIAVLIAIPALLTIVLVARTQYRLVTSTHTINKIPPHDPVFSSPPYQRHFGNREWAKIESFGCGIAIPLTTIRSEILDSDESFSSEVFRILWNSRVKTQSNGPPSPQPPKIGAVSASDSIRAEVVDATLTALAMTITTISTNFTGGLEVINVIIDRQKGAAGVFIKYLWHNDVILPRKWYQSLGIWLQLTGRRLWLMDVLNGVSVSGTISTSQGQEQRAPSRKVEL
ncbi:hypothetical protein F4821DRAFT_251701 [Hypoxylon rubiginosum]|uniref:Uncharacterized protein n=1 Tax=Hypoxylon rubiginosum TaxID=110542 RepID=A0ACC0CIU6_9PEZI|nr:hypothetical protein F4821DRAFT_251701 [Hypoxylon rubiginosum]